MGILEIVTQNRRGRKVYNHLRSRYLSKGLKWSVAPYESMNELDRSFFSDMYSKVIGGCDVRG